MDFFDIFGIKKTFDIDIDELEKNYFKQMQGATDQTIINEAFITIKDDLKRAIYLLEINNYKLKNPSSSFLHNIFDAFDTPNQKTLKTSLILKEKTLTDLKSAFAHNDYKTSGIKTSELKYIYNLIEHIKKHGSD